MKKIVKHIKQIRELLTRNNIHLRILFLLVNGLLLNNLLVGQSYSTIGDWSGEIYIQEQNKTAWKHLMIDRNLSAIVLDENKNYSSYNVTQHPSTNNSFKISLTKKARFGSETELYYLTYLNHDTLKLDWERNCVVFGVNKRLPLEQWSYHGSGYLVRKKASLEFSPVVWYNRLDY